MGAEQFCTRGVCRACDAMDTPPQPPVDSRQWTLRAAIGGVITAILVVAFGVAVPLQVTTLKPTKAEATVVPQIRVHRPPEYGVASWYGYREAGKLTASGAVFHPDELTAAHRWLPLGTKVRVTRLDTHRSVVVTINDRGPYVGGRVIDLSPAAAHDLAMMQKGLIRVRIDVLTEPPPLKLLVKRPVKKHLKRHPEDVAAAPHAPAPARDKAAAERPHKTPARSELVDAKSPTATVATPADAAKAAR